MFARLTRFNLPQGFAELAKEMVDKIVPIMARQPGFQAFQLLIDETSGEYIFLTLWSTLEQIDAFDRSADEWRVREIMSPYMVVVPEIEVYQVHNLPATPDPAGAGVAEARTMEPVIDSTLRDSG
ncbi:MAG: antibiotic biosynthesis monooxygenase [Chloroflexota bacterium]|nr:antibiotic biosynthesis monooxygenase [Chloroflexota bacterium]